MRRRDLFGVVAASALALGLGASAVAAEEDTVAAGNGGVATAEANGGTVVFDGVDLSGYTVLYDEDTGVTTYIVSANGGVAIADASGGDDNEAENED